MNPCGCPSGVADSSRCSACKKKQPIRVGGGCIRAAIVDDLNNTTYLYGNIQYEENHKPEAECLPFIAVPTKWNRRTDIQYESEIFQGEFPNNAITLKHCPLTHRPVMVFLNGLHQDEGQEYDYTLTDKKLTFTFHGLIATDRVSVKYYYDKSLEA